MPRLTFKETMDRIELLIRAGFPVLYIVSFEETRVLDCIAKVVNRIGKNLATPKSLWRWYEGTGLEFLQPSQQPDSKAQGDLDWLHAAGLTVEPAWQRLTPREPEDVLAALARIRDANPKSLPQTLAYSLTVMFDIHQYLKQDTTTTSAAAVRPLRNTADRLRRYYEDQRPSNLPKEMQREAPHQYKTVIVVAPSASNLSPELERDVLVLDFPLPETDELEMQLERMTKIGHLRFPARPAATDVVGVCGRDTSAEEYQTQLCHLIAGAGRGLTIEDYKLALNMFHVRGEELRPEHVEHMLNMKATAISDRALEYTPHVQIDLGGLAPVKEWIRLRKGPVVSDEIRSRYHLPAPKGVLLCGVSGGGKSQLAKLIAKEFNLALLRLDIGALFGMYVGESEERTRKALQLAEVLSPVVLWLDEIDKAFGGMGGGGDNGVSSRVFGHILTWLSEKRGGVFVVATANDFRTLLNQFPEFGRKGRFDEIFWVDLPSEEARQAIFRVYLEPRRSELVVAPGSVDRLRNEHRILATAPGTDSFDDALWLLSQNPISGNMTGAEIEYAVAESLYERYKRAQASPAGQQLTLEIITKVVRDAQERALYRDENHPLLTVLRTQVRGNHWVEV